MTRPNYYGVASHIGSMIEAADPAGFHFGGRSPWSSFLILRSLSQPVLELGADACVQSLHKTLPAMTQTALVHEGSSSLLGKGGF